MKSSKGYTALIQKLDQFIRKFYANKLIKGSLLFAGANLVLFLFFNLLESQFYFSTLTRSIFFYSFIGFFAVSFTYWMGIPAIKWLKLGKTISHEDAAKIIGDHFPEVKDKLLNILHLSHQSSADSDNDLLYHSVEQKTREIKLVPFPKAIDLKRNRKYIKYALPPFLILITLLFSSPTLITDSSYRILHNRTNFEKEAPFEFVLQNSNLEVPQFEDITLVMKTIGNAIPSESFISIDGFKYKMQKNKDGDFKYIIKNIGNELDFQFSANGFESKNYNIKVLKKPSLVNMGIELDFPSYTQINDKKIQNEGDITVPEGTKISWTFDTENMSDLVLSFGGEDRDTILNTTNNTSIFTKRVYRNSDYNLVFNSADILKADSVSYYIETVRDQYPKISLEKQVDSNQQKVTYAVGEVSDDYGIKELSFNYAIAENQASSDELIFTKEVLEENMGKAGTYDKIIDLTKTELKPGQSFLYYFEVYDNDAVNGSKSTKTSIQSWTKKTVEEFEQLEESNEEEIKSNLEKILKDQEILQKSAEELRNKLFQEKDLNWQRKKELEKLLDQQENIQKALEETKNLQEKNAANQEEFKDPNQPNNNEEIQKLMEQAQNPEMEKLLNKIRELMSKLKKEDAIDALQEMNNQMEQSQMDLKRLEELYKKLEMESDMQDAMQKLDQLAEEQEKLAEENLGDEETFEENNKQDEFSENKDEEGNDDNVNEEDSANDEEKPGNKNESDKNENSLKPDSDSKKKQEDLNKEFEKLSKEMEELFKKNKDLKNPMEMDDPKTPSEEIKKDQKESMENMNSGQKQKAGQKQKDASKKMKEMSESMSSSMMSGQQQQMQEDMNLVRQILENLVKLSFDQEILIEDIDHLSTATPQYVEKVQEQFKLKNDFGLIRDSLISLANRNVQIQSGITNKVNVIDNHISKSLELLEERKKSDASNDQRRTMKNVNDLALLLSEAMENMQMQMSSSSAMCNNPNSMGQGEGSEPMDRITKGQKNVTQKMKDLAKQRGNKGKGEQGSSKDFAKIAAEQAALRKMLQDKQNEKMQQGQGSKQLQELIDMMDKMETDLVNKNLTNEMLERQQEIMTRLLEAEKAERQQELDEKRKSQSANEIPKSLPQDLREYLEKRREEISPYKKLSPSLKPYYKRLVEEYYEQLKTD